MTSVMRFFVLPPTRRATSPHTDLRFGNCGRVGSDPLRVDAKCRLAGSAPSIGIACSSQQQHASGRISMMNLHDSARSSLCACGACHLPSALSRRQFLCTTAASVATISAVAATAGGTAYAQQPSGATTPGRAILIKGGCVLSLDRAVGDFEQADVLIEGKKISAVRPNISAPNAQVIDATNRIVMPGFVDTHRHMWQGFLRNVLPDGSLEDYRNVVQRTFGAKMVPDDVYAADLISALGAIDSGVTCILDWSHIQNSPAHSDACIKGLQESGVRAVFAYGAGQNENGRVMEIP